jgi:hypothetical protein
VPEVYTQLRPEQLALFDNAHLIVTLRDIASIAVRNSLSEYKQAMTALRDAVSQLAALVTYIGSVSAPSLLLSYEKALIFPGDFVDTLLLFCGLTCDAALRARLVGLVEPNRKNYLGRARRIYRGRIDGVAYGCVFGWCQRIGSNDPVRDPATGTDRRAAGPARTPRPPPAPARLFEVADGARSPPRATRPRRSVPRPRQAPSGPDRRRQAPAPDARPMVSGSECRRGSTARRRLRHPH